MTLVTSLMGIAGVSCRAPYPERCLYYEVKVEKLVVEAVESGMGGTVVDFILSPAVGEG